MMKIVKNLEWSVTKNKETGNTLNTVYLPDGSRITVLDRKTGWGGGMMDTETGLLEKNGRWWLASGMFDIRDYPDYTIEEAVNMIKKMANTCMGSKP